MDLLPNFQTFGNLIRQMLRKTWEKAIQYQLNKGPSRHTHTKGAIIEIDQLQTGSSARLIDRRLSFQLGNSTIKRGKKRFHGAHQQQRRSSHPGRSWSQEQNCLRHCDSHGQSIYCRLTNFPWLHKCQKYWFQTLFKNSCDFWIW